MMNRVLRVRVFGVILFLWVAGLFLVSIWATEAKDKVYFRLNWTFQGSHAPYFLGRERGYYEENGIELELLEGKGSGTTVTLIGNKSDTFGLADSTTTYMAASKGVPVKTIMMISQDSGLGVIFLKGTPIRNAKDLEGKSLAVTAGDSLHQLFPAVVAVNKLDESKIRLVFMDPAAKPVAVMERKVAALLGGITDQPLILKSKGFEPDYVRFSDLGVRVFGMALIAHRDTLKEKPDLVKRFLAACVKSIEETRKDPEAAVDALIKYHPERGRDVIRNQLKAYLEFDVFPESRIKGPLGYIPMDLMAQNIEILKKYRGLKTEESAEYFHTNEFLPR